MWCYCYCSYSHSSIIAWLALDIFRIDSMQCMQKHVAVAFQHYAMCLSGNYFFKCAASLSSIDSGVATTRTSNVTRRLWFFELEQLQLHEGNSCRMMCGDNHNRGKRCRIYHPRQVQFKPNTGNHPTHMQVCRHVACKTSQHILNDPILWLNEQEDPSSTKRCPIIM